MTGLEVGVGIAVFLAFFVGSLSLVTLIVVLWRPDHFVGPGRPFWDGRAPVVRMAGLVAKNCAGALIVLAGIVMALPGVPGQGILTIIIGLTLLDIPGKRRLEVAIVGRPAVLHALNTLRARLGRPPLHEPTHEA